MIYKRQLAWFAALIATTVLVVPSGIAQPGLPAPPFAPASAGQRVIYRHASLIDGTGAPLRSDMAVVVNGPVIEQVLSDRALTAAQLDGSRVVDLRGQYLLPGFIDAHQHLATPPNRARAEALMRRDLYGGITAVRIMADDIRSVGELARASLVGDIAGPDLYYPALFAGPSFFQDPRTRAASQGAEPGKVPWMQAVTDETDLRTAIALARGTFATGIKIYANLPPRLVTAIAREAHRQGMPVWAHGMVFPTPPMQVIEAGPDVISHVCYLAYQVSEKRPASYQERFPVDYSRFGGGDNRQMGTLFRDMKRKGIILDATNRVYVAAEAAAAGRPGNPPHCTSKLAFQLTSQAYREGVTIAAGTDGATSRRNPYSALHEELELLVEKAGMPPLQAIRSATLVGAMTMGKQAVMGSIERGKIANLVVLSKNPLERMSNIRSVVMTVKRGRQFWRVDFRPIGAEEIPDER
jgi:imidazolonepropionase-like amidohydrolase